MKPNSLYAQLELIPDPLDGEKTGLGDRPLQTDYAIGRVWATAQSRLYPWARAVLAYFCGSTELRVTVRGDRQGNPLFIAYDPVSQQRHTFRSEQALRDWADQRYYH